MEIAKIFPNGQSQDVCLPKECRFTGDEVYAQKLGDAVLLIPKDKVWEVFMEGLNSFSSDFMQDGRVEQTGASGEGF